MAETVSGFGLDHEMIKINWCSDAEKIRDNKVPSVEKSSVLDSYFPPNAQEDVDLDLFECLGVVDSSPAGFRDLKDYLSAFGNHSGESLCSGNPFLFLKTVLTRENFAAFEQKFLDTRLAKTNVFPEDLLLKLRQHGRGLFGVDVLEKKLKKKFGLEIETENFSAFSKNYKHHRVPVSQLGGRLKSLDKKFASYPREIFTSAKLRRIGLCSQLDVKSSQDDVTHNAGYALENYFVFVDDMTTFHHELFHCLDFVDGLSEDDVFYASSTHGQAYDSQWLQDKTNYGLHPGFLTYYGVAEADKTGLFTEDQADVAMWLTGGLYQRAMYAGKMDPIIAAKISAIKRVYHAKSNGLMDEKYWRDIEHGLVPDDAYWAQKRREKFNVAEPGGYALPRETVFVEDRLAQSAYQFRQEKLLDQAAHAYENLVLLSPENGGYHTQLGRIYFDRGEKTKAMEHWELAAQYGVRSPDMFRDLTRLYTAGSFSVTWLDPLLRPCAFRSDVERAIDRYEILLQRAPHNTQVWEELATAWVKKGEVANAWQVYETRRQQLEGHDESRREAVFYFYARFLRRVWPRLNPKNRDLMMTKLLRRMREIQSDAVYYSIVKQVMEMGEWYLARGLIDLRSEKALTDLGVELEKTIQAKLDKIECP